jgi:phosphoserine aminotransferase
MGAAGVNLVVINKNITGKVQRIIPTVLDYRNHIKEESMLNTPPVFAVYVAMLTLRWLKGQGGVAAIETINDQKADLLYSTLEAVPFINLPVAKEDRSKMNVVFTMNDEKLEKEFSQLCKDNGMYGVKGHRSVGGFRISLYNALPLSSVEAVVSLIKDFAQTHG